MYFLYAIILYMLTYITFALVSYFIIFFGFHSRSTSLFDVTIFVDPIIAFSMHSYLIDW